MEFHPAGLERKIHVEQGKGKNGGIIKWVIPGTSAAIFEWAENYNIGAHYYAMLPLDNNRHRGDYNPPDAAVIGVLDDAAIASLATIIWDTGTNLME